MCAFVCLCLHGLLMLFVVDMCAFCVCILCVVVCERFCFVALVSVFFCIYIDCVCVVFVCLSVCLYVLLFFCCWW